jgi:predicted anti-sigma-YlaC factor YlaD
MECREVREYLPAYVEQAGGPIARDVDRHLATCSECSTELGQHREMQTALGVLATQTLEPPSWLPGTLTDTITQRAARRETIRNAAEKVMEPKVVVTGGALVAAGLAGALLMRGRRRRRRTSIGRFREALAEA